MLDTVALLGALAVVEAVERAHKIARDAADTLEGLVRRLAAAAARAGIADDAVKAADRVAVDRVVDGAVADAALAHEAHDLLECWQILQRVAVHFNIGDVPAVRQRVIGRLDAELVKGGDRIIHRHMEAVRVILAVRHAGDHAEALGIHPDKAAGKALCRGGKAGEIQAASRRFTVSAVTDAANDLKAKRLRLGAFTVVRAGQRFQALGKADEADGERAVLESLLYKQYSHSMLRQVRMTV